MRNSWCPRGLTRRGFLAGMSAGAFLLPSWRNAGFRDADRHPFEEISAERSGIRWRHANGKSFEKYLPESTGAGCAFLDYDNDGDGTFSDVTAKAGLSAPGWGTSAVWFDYDNDGRLDLFVCHFVEFSKELNKPCGVHEDGRRHYCIPKVYSPKASWLFHNNGDGTFTDASKDSGIAGHLGKAWGVVATDVNNDGLMDLWVANDTVANFLFINRGNGKFDEIATAAGVAYSADGKARSGMGVDSADLDQDGWMDLFVSNLDRELFALYENNHDEAFDDLALPSGIGKATRFMSGWGLKFFDYDNDGDLDLFLANGNPDDLISSLHGEVTYEEPLILFHNTGKSFQDVSAQSGPVFAK